MFRTRQTGVEDGRGEIVLSTTAHCYLEFALASVEPKLPFKNASFCTKYSEKRTNVFEQGHFFMEMYKN